MIFFYLPLSPWRFSPFVADNLVYHVAAFIKAQKIEKHGSINRPFNWSIRLAHACLIAFALLLISCASSSRPTVCGVPVQGSPWQLAASIHDNGNHSFEPTCVDLVTTTKAYISGYLFADSLGNPLPTEQPATLICDLSPKGEVCGVVLDNEQ